MARHTQELIAYSLFEAVHNADVLFEQDKYCEWVIVTPKWENDGKGDLVFHRSRLSAYVGDKRLKDVQKNLLYLVSEYEKAL